MYKGDLLKHLTGCSLLQWLWTQSPRIQKLLSPQCWMSRLVFNICWSSKDADSNASGVSVLARQEQSFLLLFLISRSLAQIKGVPSRLKVRIKHLCLPTQRSGFPHFKPSKKSRTGVLSISGLSSWRPRIAIALPSVSLVACCWSWSQKQGSDLTDDKEEIYRRGLVAGQGCPSSLWFATACFIFHWREDGLQFWAL